MLKENREIQCRCHGASASCVTRTCWQALPSFQKVGLQLKRRYEKPVLARTVKYPSRDGKRDAYLLKSGDGEKPSPKDLVYIDKQVPNYCDEHKLKRIPGTVERKCNKTSSGSDGCKFLCCGRGYDTHEIVRRWDCNCKFHWCCYVKCKKCKERTEEFRCK